VVSLASPHPGCGLMQFFENPGRGGINGMLRSVAS